MTTGQVFVKIKSSLVKKNALQKREKAFLTGPLPIRSPVVPLHGQVRIFYNKLCICSAMELIMEALDLIIGSYKEIKKLCICSVRELITEPSDLPNPRLEWTILTTAPAPTVGSPEYTILTGDFCRHFCYK